MRNIPDWLSDSEADREYGAAPVNRGRSIVHKPCQDVVKNFKWSRLDAEATRIIREARQAASGITIRAASAERTRGAGKLQWKFKTDDIAEECTLLELEFSRALNRKNASYEVVDAIYGALGDIRAMPPIVAGRGRKQGRQERHGRKIHQTLKGQLAQARRTRLNRKRRKLTTEQARQIRLEYQEHRTSYAKLAKKYGVTYGLITSVVYGDVYSDAGGPLYWPEIGWFDTLEHGRALMLARVAALCAA